MAEPVNTANSVTVDNTHTAPGRGFWLLMALSLAAVGAVAYLQFTRVDQARRGLGTADGPASLPVINTLHDFTLTERSGQAVSLDDLKGGVWIADFIFTNCAGPCPVMTNRMLDLQNTLQRDRIEGVKLVTITVDPAQDTPAVLRDYAATKGASPKRWLFLTGDKKKIYDLVLDGFKLGVADDGDREHQIIHSTRFALVDREGRLRAAINVMTDEEMYDPQAASPRLSDSARRELLRGIRALLREPQP